MFQTSEDIYQGYSKTFCVKVVITRGYHKDHNGDALQGQWCVYDLNTGELLDYSPFRHDLIEKWFA